MKTIILIFIVVILAGLYDDVHALRVKFAPAPVEVTNDSPEAHPQPAHKPDGR